jgi:hypothetical protein
VAQVERAKEEKSVRKGGAAKEQVGAARWIGFVSCELGKDEREAVKDMIGDAARVWNALLGLVALRYKLTLSYDELHNTYNASLTCQDAANRNGGLTLSGRGGSVEAAICALWYKHDVALGGDWQRAGLSQRTLWQANDVG